MPKSTLLNSRMKKYAYRDAQEICQDIPTTLNGLPIDQVEAMREQYGENQLTGRKNDTLWYRFRRAFINPFTIIDHRCPAGFRFQQKYYDCRDHLCHDFD